MSPKVEPWRLVVLASQLEVMQEALKSGRQPEWAGVFGHFLGELFPLISNPAYEPGRLKKLVDSIKLCFESARTLPFSPLAENGLGELDEDSRRLAQLRTHIGKSLEEIERRLAEYVS